MSEYVCDCAYVHFIFCWGSKQKGKTETTSSSQQARLAQWSGPGCSWPDSVQQNPPGQKEIPTGQTVMEREGSVWDFKKTPPLPEHKNYDAGIMNLSVLTPVLMVLQPHPTWDPVAQVTSAGLLGQGRSIKVRPRIKASLHSVLTTCQAVANVLYASLYLILQKLHELDFIITMLMDGHAEIHHDEMIHTRSQNPSQGSQDADSSLILQPCS